MTAIIFDDRYQKATPASSTDPITLDFPIANTADLTVLVDGVETTDYTVTATFSAGLASGATVNINTPVVANPTIEIIGTRDPARTQFVVASGHDLVEKINSEVAQRTVEIQELARDRGRSLKLHFGETPGDLIATVAQRKDRFLAFDANGNPVAKELTDLDAAALSDAAPSKPLTTGTGGTSAEVSRADHQHPLPDVGSGLTRTGDVLDVANAQFFDSRATVGTSSVNSDVESIQTGGYTTSGDGGGAIYKRVVAEPSHEHKVQSADGAWWEGAGPVIRLEMLGAVGDGVTDDGPAIQNALDAQESIDFPVVGRSGITYFIATGVTADHDVDLRSDGPEPMTFKANADGPSIVLDLNKNSVATTTLNADLRMDSESLDVADAANISDGRLIRLVSTKAWYFDPREDSDIGSTDATGTAQAGGANTITLKAATVATNFVGKNITIEDGTGAGQSREVTNYDDGTKVATVDRNWATNPDSTSEYRFPFSFKGELQRVQRVSINTVFVEGQVWDGYDITDNEAVTVEIYDPITPYISGLHIERTIQSGFDNYGIRVRGAAFPHLERVTTFGCTHTGISVSTCYKGQFAHCSAEDSRADPLSYGIQCFNGYGNNITNWRSYNCRRGVDFSGVTPERKSTLDGFEITGGGTDYDGTRRKPFGTASSQGFGSHGAVEGSVYRNGTVQTVGSIALIRGGNETIENVIGFGVISDEVIRWVHGMNLTLRNVHYYSLSNEGSQWVIDDKTKENDPFGGTNIRASQPEYFLGAFTPVKRGHLSIHGCSARNIRTAFIGLSSSITPKVWHDFDLSDIFVGFEPNASSAVALIGSQAGTHVLSGFFQNNINMIHRSGPEAKTFGSSVTGYPTVADVSDIFAWNDLGSPRTYVKEIADDAVGQIMIPGNPTKLKFGLFSDSTISFRAEAIMQANSATIVEVGALTSVEASATALGGTSGNDAVVTVHFNGERFYLENRSGSTRVWYVTIYPTI